MPAEVDTSSSTASAADREITEALRSCGPLLLARAFRLTRNRADAWDLLQDSLERMLKQESTPPSAEGLQRWLSVVMRNLNTDRYRTAQRHRHVSLTEGMLVCEPPAISEEPAWALVEREQLDRCVARLDPPLREAYCLSVEQRLPLTIAARTLGIPAATVGTRVHRARRRLRALLLSDVGSSAATGVDAAIEATGT